jgi:hypothetical protein
LEARLRKFEREIARRTFEHSGLIKVAKFLRYEQIRQTWQRDRSVGAGKQGLERRTSKAKVAPGVDQRR